MRNEELIYIESSSRQELLIPLESSRMEIVPLSRVRQPRAHKLFEPELIYLSEHMNKLKENFVRKYYPMNKLKRGPQHQEHQTSEVIKFMCDELLQRGQDKKATLLAADSRDKEIFGSIIRMFEKYNLKKQGKQVQQIVQEREAGSLYGGLSSKRGDTLDYFYKMNGQVGEPGVRQGEKRKENGQGKYAKFVESADQSFKGVLDEMKKDLERKDEEEEESNVLENKENDEEASAPPKKRSSPHMNSLMHTLYQKSLPAKSKKRVQ